MKQLAKNLRKNQTDAEEIIWNKIRNRQLSGIKFRRQQPLGNFIVDFMSYEKRIVIEIDGGQHFEQREKDSIKDSWLHSQGFKVLRFWNNEIFQNIEGVLEVIMENCTTNHPHPTSPIKGEEKRNY